MNTFPNILSGPRLQLEQAIQGKLDSLEQTLATIRAERERAKKCGSATLTYLHNVTICMLLVNVDYTIALRGLSLNDDKLTQGFYARQMILCYHEFFEDYQKLFGKGLREVLGGLPKSDQYMQRLSEIGKEMRAFRDQHAKRFRDIRNTVAAHRDHDGEKQLQMMDQINVEELQKLTSDLETWFDKLWHFSIQIMTDYRELMEQAQKGIAYFMSLMPSPNDLGTSAK